ncbi:cyclin-A2-like [Gracilinanus agilis]|uniref:cyclin-A2-like n=1 Tax=Gracilinanus agilis TaxID=191870 RepID=UPI001CFDA407|nr:cyclin-A2-like [Gracilinanus agilis]
MLQAPQKPKRQSVVGPLRDIPVNDERDTGPRWKATSKKAAFIIQVNEPDDKNGKKFLIAQKVPCEDDVLGFNSAVSLPETKALAPRDYPMDGSFESSIAMDTSVEVEADGKPRNINEVPDYQEDIYLYLRKMEAKYKPKVGYMEKQPEITNSMRAILVDWLVDVGEEYSFQNETLHLAVNYVDRYLSSVSVLRGKLQLVGIAAIFLASKFEEICPPDTTEFMCLTDGLYTKSQIVGMEQMLLGVLAFDLAVPTIIQFLTHYFLHQQQANSKVESLAMFLGELSLMDADPYLKYLPSVTAGAAFHLALYTITGKSWPESLIQKTGYTLESLKPCLMDLHQTYLRAPHHALQCIQEKYKTEKYHCVSLINPPETLNLE